MKHTFNTEREHNLHAIRAREARRGGGERVKKKTHSHSIAVRTYSPGDRVNRMYPRNASPARFHPLRGLGNERDIVFLLPMMYVHTFQYFKFP